MIVHFASKQREGKTFKLPRILLLIGVACSATRKNKLQPLYFQQASRGKHRHSCSVQCNQRKRAKTFVHYASGRRTKLQTILNTFTIVAVCSVTRENGLKTLYFLQENEGKDRPTNYHEYLYHGCSVQCNYRKRVKMFAFGEQVEGGTDLPTILNNFTAYCNLPDCICLHQHHSLAVASLLLCVLWLMPTRVESCHTVGRKGREQKVQKGPVYICTSQLLRLVLIRLQLHIHSPAADYNYREDAHEDWRVGHMSTHQIHKVIGLPVCNYSHANFTIA